jgi:hypothetical protein
MANGIAVESVFKRRAPKNAILANDFLFALLDPIAKPLVILAFKFALQRQGVAGPR